MTTYTAELAANAQVVAGLELRATVQMSSGRPDLAAGLLQLAADVAARNHPGWFVSPAMEAMIRELGRLLDPDAPGVDPEGPISHVLAGEAGVIVHGAREWWRFDSSARLVALPSGLDGVLADAAQVRRELAGSSMVVLHGDGAALAPLIAMAGWARRPPVVLVEHDALTGWPGVGVLDAVVHSSGAAMALASERRCLPTGRSVLVEPHERDDPVALFEVLLELRERMLDWPAPAVPHALLPAQPSLVDQRVLAHQIEAELTDGVAGALRRWQVPAELTGRPGWVIAGRDPDRVLSTMRDLLDERPDVVPDIVVVDMDGTGALGVLAVQLAGVVEIIEPGQPLDVDRALSLGVRQLISDELLLVTDGLGVDASILDELLIDLRAGAPAVGIAGLPEGERCEVRRHPRLVGWPAAQSLGHPAGRGTPPDPDNPGGHRTPVRDVSEITEKRGELFHTESEVPSGPSDPMQ